jgi:hypothetical protein
MKSKFFKVHLDEVPAHANQVYDERSQKVFALVCGGKGTNYKGNLENFLGK